MTGALVLVDGSLKVANIVDLFDDNTSLDPNATPQKNVNKKKQKGDDGVAMDSTIVHHELPSVDVPEVELMA